MMLHSDCVKAVLMDHCGEGEIRSRVSSLQLGTRDPDSRLALLGSHAPSFSSPLSHNDAPFGLRQGSPHGSLRRGGDSVTSFLAAARNSRPRLAARLARLARSVFLISSLSQ